MQPRETPSSSNPASLRSLRSVAERVAKLPLNRAVDALTRHVVSHSFLDEPVFELCLRALYVAASLGDGARTDAPPQGLLTREIHRALASLATAEAALGPDLASLLTRNLVRRLPGVEARLTIDVQRAVVNLEPRGPLLGPRRGALLTRNLLRRLHGRDGQ